MPDEEQNVLSAGKAAAIRARLAELALEQARLESALQTLEASAQSGLPLSPASPTVPASPTDKVALFLRLFAARRSVFPKFWENPKTGKKGSPAKKSECGAARRRD